MQKQNIIVKAILYRNEELIRKLVEEGLKAGKTPWCCCGVSEFEALKILNCMGDYPQESCEETTKRRSKRKWKKYFKKREKKCATVKKK